MILITDRMIRRYFVWFFLAGFCMLFLIRSNIQGKHLENKSEFVHEMHCPSDEDIDKNKTLVDSTISMEFVAHDTSTNKIFFSLLYRPLLNCLYQDHPHIKKVLQNEYIKPWDGKDYNLNYPRSHYTFASKSQSEDIWSMIFRNRVKNGFFVEAGASLCDTDSVTLPFELNLNWTGLLVEAVPQFFKICSSKHRRVSMVQTCLATEEGPHYVKFDYSSAGTINNNNTEIQVMPGISQKDTVSTVQMQCFPVFSLLEVMNKTVNLFVLDVEGAEYNILKTIPFNRVDIEVFDIETDLAVNVQSGSRDDIIELLEKAGYTRFDHSHKDFNYNTGRNQNDLFVRNDIVAKYNVRPLEKSS